MNGLNSVLVALVSGFLAGVVPAYLLYRANKNRDPIEAKKAETAGAAAASEAWAEYAAAMEGRLQRTEDKLERLERVETECRDEIEALRTQVRGLERRRGR